MALATAPTQTEIDRDTEFRWIPIDRLFVPAYGRSASDVKVRKLVRSWDMDAIGVLMVSQRLNGEYAVIDGQHRWLAAKQVGERLVPARVYKGIGYEREAELYGFFATVNKQSASDRLKARIEAREPVALEIKRVIEKHGLAVGFGGFSGEGRLTAIDAAERAAQYIGVEGLDRVLGILRESWGLDQAAYQSHILGGMAMFLRRYSAMPQFQRARLIMALEGQTPRAVAAQSNQLKAMGITTNGTTTGAFGLAIWHLYNKGLRSNKLPDWAAVDQRRTVQEDGEPKPVVR